MIKLVALITLYFFSLLLQTGKTNSKCYNKQTIIKKSSVEEITTNDESGWHYKYDRLIIKL